MNLSRDNERLWMFVEAYESGLDRRFTRHPGEGDSGHADPLAAGADPMGSRPAAGDGSPCHP